MQESLNVLTLKHRAKYQPHYQIQGHTGSKIKQWNDSHDTSTDLETIHREAPRFTLVTIWICVRQNGGSLLLHSTNVRVLNRDRRVWYDFVIARILPDVTSIERLSKNMV
jgi:hypothetical protein